MGGLNLVISDARTLLSAKVGVTSSSSSLEGCSTSAFESENVTLGPQQAVQFYALLQPNPTTSHSLRLDLCVWLTVRKRADLSTKIFCNG